MFSVSALARSFRASYARTLPAVANARSLSNCAVRLNAGLGKTQGDELTTEKDTKQQVDLSSLDTIEEKNILNSNIITALKSLGFKNLTSVQAKTLEAALTHTDLITKAKTGTGKTLAFGIPLIEQILRKPHGHKGVRALIVAPTRDLAFQIRDELNKVASHSAVTSIGKNALSVKTFVGGESRWDQIRYFKNRRIPPPSIIVATPGRFLDVIQEQIVADAFTDLQTLVLDEADRLLGEGFKEDLVEISDILKELRTRSSATDIKPLKTMLFSATMDRSILEFSKRILNEEHQFVDTVDPNEPETHEKIEQSLILTEDVFESYVSAALFIENEAKRVKNFKAIVFLPTVKSVSYFYETLAAYLNASSKMRTFQLHGQLRQPVRDRSVKMFRSSFSGVLVASDVGARGMDFPNVTNVIQIGLPMDATNYVHRVGRTARGGKTGQAVMILTQGEERFVRILKRRNVEVAKKFAYEKNEEAEARFAKLSQEVSHKNSLDLVVESLCGFAKSVVGTYKLNLFDMIEGISKGYGKFVGDQSQLPPLSPNFVYRVLNLNKADAADLFATSGGDSYGSRSPVRRTSYRQRDSEETEDDQHNSGQYKSYRNNRNNNSRQPYGNRDGFERNHRSNHSTGNKYNQRSSRTGRTNREYKSQDKPFRF